MKRKAATFVTEAVRGPHRKEILMTSATGNEPLAARSTDRARQRSSGGSGLFTLLWLVFLAFLIFQPERLDALWSWFRDLPVAGQVVGWVLLLPLVLGLLIWQAPWALWVRVSLIVVLALANVVTVAPRSS
jgi:hypothetical protein